MKKKIALFGPHDRFNYGDFLFPLMLEYAIEKNYSQKFEFEKYSLINADFSKRGAYKSKNYRTLKKDINKGGISAVIVAGGECLNVDWSSLLHFISFKYSYLLKYSLMKKIFFKTNFAARVLGGKTEHAFCVNKKDFRKKFLLIYNSVGGFRKFNKIQINNLNQSDYIALRDNKTFENSKTLSKEAFLVPDSAVILSDVFVSEELESNSFVRNSVRDLLNKKYIFFQVSNIYHQNRQDEICVQLESLSKQHNLEIVLCPIGMASGHEDHIVLENIYRKLNCLSYLIENPNIQEIALLISRSKIYLGSSLHGLITAMSYGIPYIGLNRTQTKVISYLDTWSFEPLKIVCDLHDFSSTANTVIVNEDNLKPQILENSKCLKALYYDSVEKMITILSN